jgi:(p)ppGpp synthase/HD superfamily hydrolase
VRRDGHLAPPRGRDKRKFHATLERAIEIAAAAHAGQVDKAGQPYVLHPIRVMLRVTGSHARMAAILHDVVEDTPATIDQLVGEGFPAEVVAAVIALTKLPGESRLAAAARAAADPIAHAVKLADNAENMDLGRIAAPTARDHARLAEYEQVRAPLLAHADRAAPPGA